MSPESSQSLPNKCVVSCVFSTLLLSACRCFWSTPLILLFLLFLLLHISSRSRTSRWWQRSTLLHILRNLLSGLFAWIRGNLLITDSNSPDSRGATICGFPNMINNRIEICLNAQRSLRSHHWPIQNVNVKSNQQKTRAPTLDRRLITS